jgi:uncharacterized protein (DUF433 family)
MNPDVGDRITKIPGICGGEACLRGTRLPVWGFVERKLQGATDEELRQLFRPPLTREDLNAVWAYAVAHPEEVERALWLNAAAELEPGTTEILAPFIREGQRLGLTEVEIREAFEPPLTAQDLDQIVSAPG